MVMVTAKLSKGKLLVIGLLVVAAAVVLAVCLGGSGKAPAQEQAPAAAADGIRTNEDRIAYLQSYGWQVSEEPTQMQEVRIPTETNEVFTRYNDLQISQGFDLTEFAGKTVKRYVYEVKNHPGDDGIWYATVLVYKNNVIGGDVASADQKGVMHGFAKA